MRRISKKILVLLLLVGGLYLISHPDFLIASSSTLHPTIPPPITWQESQQLDGPESWVDQGDYLPLNVSYERLAGAPATRQRFLCIGISSVKRKKGNYLLTTLRSLFTQSSSQERSSMVVVVLLADFDASWRASTVREIKTAFPSELEQSQLVVLHVPQDWYPPITGVCAAGYPYRSLDNTLHLHHPCPPNCKWVPAFVGVLTYGGLPSHPGGLIDSNQLHATVSGDNSWSRLKRNYNDLPERVTFRSKQNLDYSFLIHYCRSLAQYYLQLEDDISSAKNFLSTIRKRVNDHNVKSTNWATLEFSALGYIGKLYQSVHLPLLARFLFLFYQEMPCDWLMSHFRELLTQKQPILFKPSLFQHMGTFSSFQGTYNKLKDKDFVDALYANPPADVYTDLSTFQAHYPKKAWENGEGFFWGRTPEKGNYLTVVFKHPAVVTGISVETGSEGKDLLESAVVEIGHEVVTTKKQERTCNVFQLLGTVEYGSFEMQEIDKKYSFTSSCIRLQVTAGQKDWVILKKIRVTTKS